MAGERERLSACLIVQDEEERLPGALESIAFCDEIVVVDGGSTDRTREIARAAGAIVIENPWPGFAAQRNVALDAASSEWVLEIDADERISTTLRASIEALLEEAPPDEDMAVFALRNRFLGGPLGPSAKYPAYRSRLFRRGAYRHDEGRAVHEGLELRARPVILDGDLEHELAGSLGEALGDMRSYAQLESRHIVRPSSPLAYVKGLLLRPAAKFAYRVVVDGGWRDGWRGLAKISLDVGSDVWVWGRVLTNADPSDGASADATPAGEQGEHFGRRRVGPVKVVAVASSPRSAAAAASRLSALRERGADVALIAAAEPADDHPGLAFMQIPRVAPLTLIRAIEAEMHVRPIDVVVGEDPRARLALKLLPGSFRPQLHDLDGTRELRWS